MFLRNYINLDASDWKRGTFIVVFGQLRQFCRYPATWSLVWFYLIETNHRFIYFFFIIDCGRYFTRIPVDALSVVLRSSSARSIVFMDRTLSVQVMAKRGVKNVYPRKKKKNKGGWGTNVCSVELLINSASFARSGRGRRLPGVQRPVPKNV